MAMLRIIATALVLSGAFARDQVNLVPDVKAGTHPLLSFKRQSLCDQRKCCEETTRKIQARKMQPAHKFHAQKLTQKAAAANPNFRHTLFKPEGQPMGSVILLAPWGGVENWWVQWLGENFATLRQKYRVLEAVGKHIVQPNATYNAWYKYKDWDAELPVTADFDLAVAYVHSLIEQEYRIVKDYHRIVLAGYSQGSVLALESGLRFTHPLGLVFSQRGLLLESRKKHCKGLAATTYIMTTGEYDCVYPKHIVHHDSHLLRVAKLRSFFLEIPGLDHLRLSQKENSLFTQSVSVVLSHYGASSLSRANDKQLENSLGKVTDWTDNSHV